MARIRANNRERSLATHHNNNVTGYLIWLQHQVDTLQQASTTGIEQHAKLIEPIFQQMLTTKLSPTPPRSLRTGI
jgi:hypothetical protein